MRSLGHTLLLVFLLLPIAGRSAFAQDTTADTGYSPYSLFGFGQLAGNGTAYNATMAGLGIGDRNNRFINTVNPAAVTAREDKSFMMDFGVLENNVLYEAQPEEVRLRSANNTFNMSHIVFSFPMWKDAAFKAGIQPYSSVGYNLRSYENSDELLAEVGDIQYHRIGQGGLYKAFIGGAATLWDCLSVGVDGQYYFGNIVRYSYAVFTNSSLYRSINSGWDDYLSGVNAKFGLQYSQKLGGNVQLVAGATFQVGTTLSGERRRFAYGIASSTDTITDVTTPLEGYRMPAEFGAGFTLRGGDRWMVGFDYTMQDWTKTTFDPTPGIDYATAPRQCFRLGAELTPNRYDIRYFFRRLTYHGGLYYERGSLSMGGRQIDDMGVTRGVSIPVSRYYNSISLGVSAGQRGTLEDGLVRERYVTFHLAFSLHDIWFLKQMYE